VVPAARPGPSTSTDAALERSCRTYWFPLCAFGVVFMEEQVEPVQREVALWR
jgi:hypothetical protein